MRTSLGRRVLDECIFVCVGIWVVAKSRREWLRLLLRQFGRGVFLVRGAVPILANEKFLWRKLFDHDPRFVTVTDKVAAKDWVVAQGIDCKMPQTLWSGTDARTIPDAVWETPMYLKAAHGCQMNIPVPESPEDRERVIGEANAFLDQDHGTRRREWAYSGVPRRLIAEEAIGSDRELIDIKYYTYGEKVEQILTRVDGATSSDLRWALQHDGRYALFDPMGEFDARAEHAKLPDIAYKGLEIASQIGRQFDHIRVDILTDGETIYLGELTVYSRAGTAYGQGHYLAAPMNRSWDLRRSWFLTTQQPGWRGIYAAALKRALDRRHGPQLQSGHAR